MIIKAQKSLCKQAALALSVILIITHGQEARWATAGPLKPLKPLDEASGLDKQLETLYDQGKYLEAVPLAERSLVLREQSLGASHPDVATSLSNLALLYQSQGAFSRAESLLTRALTIDESVLGAAHPAVATLLNNLALLYQVQGKLADAESRLVRALAIREQTLEPTHPDIALVLGNLATIYLDQGKPARAEPLMVRALAIQEKAFGPIHPAVAKSLGNLASLYLIQGDAARAEPLMIRALAIQEKTLGSTHPDVITSLHNLANLYQNQGAYARAEPLLVRALTVREHTLGPAHPNVANSLNDLANLYHKHGEYTRANPLLVRALAIREQALGPSHPDVARCLKDLASLYLDQGEYARAEPMLLRALAITEQNFGATHPDVATSLHTLASLYSMQGTFTRAEPLFIRSLAVFEESFGPTHPMVATSLHSLASLYQSQGMYARAEPLFVHALAIQEKSLGSTHPDLAAGLNNLATLYFEQGAYAHAEPLFVRSLAIRERALGPWHPDVAYSLSNLAMVYEAQGTYARAEPLLVRALAIQEKSLRASHPDIAISLNNLASLYEEHGARGRAEPLLARALAIHEQAFGRWHPSVAADLSNLAIHYDVQGEFTRAEPLLIRALAILEKTIGTTHPRMAQGLTNLARHYQVRGADAPAELLYARAAEIYDGYLGIELGRLSEARKRDLMALLQRDTQALVSFHAHDVPTSVRALETAFTAELRRKGRVLDALVENQGSLRAHLTPELRDKLAQLADASTQLSTRLRAPYDARTAANQREEIRLLRARIDTLEGELNAASGAFRARSEPVTLARVQAALPRGAALVELVRYHRRDARMGEQPWQEARYLAYLLLPQGPPRWVPLGEANALDAAVDKVLGAMRKDAPAETARGALRDLDARLLAPIRSRLPGVSHLIIAPDDRLNLVPFEALIDEQGRPALERYLISYLTSGRDLLRLATSAAPRSPATIVAEPDYGPGPAFTRLAGARAEGQEIADYLSAPRVLTGEHATKAALGGLAGPAVLHIATHGFYAHGGAAPVAPAAPAERGMRLEEALLPALPEAADPTDALERAGLALAGANLGPDGVASARELAGWDLWGTQLVVLSACETGVGAVPSGDGVYGMRRALVLAGARTQVVSLWSVSDAATLALMRAFYRELARGGGRAQALRQAKLALLHQPRFAHPYYWAAFIAAGDWTPLDQAAVNPAVAGR